MSHLHRRRRQSAKSCDFLYPVIRIFGLLTTIVVCGVGTDVYLHGHKPGAIILICAAILLFFETKWILTIFFKLILNNDENSIFLRCWQSVGFFGGWRLAPPYVAFGTGLILWPYHLWLSYVAGVLLIVLAILRLLTLIRYSGSGKDEELLTQCDFERIENFHNIHEDSCVEISPNLENDEPIDEFC